MPVITFVEANGTSHEVQAETGHTLMQTAIDNMIDGIVAECGGSCSCATCHCYIDPAWMDKVGQASGMEQDMLECVIEPKDNSRLSCQVVITDELDGLTVTLPASQY